MGTFGVCQDQTIDSHSSDAFEKVARNSPRIGNFRIVENTGTLPIDNRPFRK